jgi:hypothetical protein
LLTSNPKARDTSLQLFNHHDAALVHDFPIAIDQLISRTAGFLGTREQVILDRTPVGAFFRFLDEKKRQDVCNAMGTTTHRVAHFLGRVAIDQHTPAPLKACAECVLESLSEGQSSYWRTTDQVPGAYVCPVHGSLLRIANSEAHRRARSELILPHMLADNDWLDSPCLSPESIDRLRIMTDWSLALRITSNSAAPAFDSAILRDACHLQAKALGWVAIDGTLQFKQIRQAITSTYAELLAVPGLEFLAGSKLEHGGFVGLLLRRSEGVHHPLMFIALLSFLFATPQQFFTSHDRATQLTQTDRRALLLSERMTLSTLLRELVVKAGLSVNLAAKEIGITPTRALVLLKEMGIRTERRPRIVGTALEPILIKRLISGDTAAKIAADLNIRRGFIKDYLASRPDLRRTHDISRFNRRREGYRSRFQQILEAHPSLPVKRIRREMNSGFEWLYRHDRTWLAQVLPGIWHRQA